MRNKTLTVSSCIVAFVLSTYQPLPAGDDIDLRRLEIISTSAEPDKAEISMARVLQPKLRELYNVELRIANEPPRTGQHAVLLGRGAAIASGVISEGELEAVKYDGYVIKGAGSRVALAGYAPQGTIYATYLFLRQSGLKLYPWRNFGAVEIHEPLKDGIMRAFSISSKPFFSRRDLLGWLDQGRWGASLREYSLGELRFCQDHEYFKGKGWLGGDHTAPYLVPMGKYYDEHPEYYAMKGGKRIPKATKNVRVAICMSDPDVHRIAIQRALEWMEIQKQRRFFHITDGDTSECQCPKCVAMDPVPGSYTDRYLKWVNSVARAVKERFPDNIVLPIAYGAATYPPVEEQLESNAVIMYCPWYWTSRATSAVTWANPLNITAMKQFMAWAIMFPNQMGLYDYPGSWVWGQAGRIKFLAKNNARVFYSCGGNGDLFQWVNARLLWDPFLNTEDLVTEFVHAYYGPAATPIGTYVRLRREAIERGFIHNRDAFKEPTFIRETKDLMEQAEQLSRQADDPTQARILTGVLDGLHLVLENTHPVKGRPALRSDPAAHRREIKKYVELSKRLFHVYQRLNSKYVVRQYRSKFQAAMAKLGFNLSASEKKNERASMKEDIFDRATATIEHQLKKLSVPEEKPPEEIPKAVSLRFDSPDEAENWLSDGSQPNLISPPVMATIHYPSGERQRGVRIQAPLSKLPVIPYRSIKIHAGRFYAERVFDEPVDATGCFFLDFHLYASRDTPITIYVNNVHSDVDLHAGEQIVRIDFRNYKHDRFNYEIWDKHIRRIGFDIWPQDNCYPYPECRDTEIVFFGMTATNQKPAPERLPHRGKAIWLSQFRPNIPRGVSVPRELYDKYVQRQKYRHVGLDYGSRWIHERFRTFTEHRAVSPIFAILTGARASRAELEAAANLQTYLRRMFGVKLPVNPDGLRVSPHAGNVIILGKDACLTAHRVKEKELEHVRADGFVINAHNGRIAIAGADDEGTAYGVARYLEAHRVRFFAADRVEAPDLKADLLHELYLLDWPYFKERPINGGWQLKTPLSAAPPAQEGSVTAARTLAEAIKDAARAGKKELPSSLITEANKSTLSRHVAAKLLWDPFTDASRLIREFTE